MKPYLLRKLWNARVNRSEFRRVQPVLRSLPPVVYVEPTNLCTLRCALCPSGQRQIKPVGKMTMETFRRVLDVLGPTAREIHLYNWGEPFLHADMPDMIAYAKKFGPETVVSTNLNNLDEATAKAIIEAGLDRVNASIDGVSQEAYEAYRVGGDLALVMENLRMLCRLKQEAKSRLPLVEWQFLVSKQNEAEMPQAREMAAELGVKFHAKKIRVGLSEFDSKASGDVAQDGEWVSDDERYNRYAKKRKRVACKSLWDRTIILWNGAISPCCQVFKAKHNFVQEFPEDFMAFWNGPEYVAARKIFTDEGNADARKLKLVCVGCAAAGNIL